MMIRHGEYRDIPSLKKIWIQAFGEDRLFIKDFFENVFRGEDTLCYEEAGEVAAMLYMLPCAIENERGKRTAYYFYALATKESFRGRGIMGRLIHAAMEEIRHAGGGPVFLIPENGRLERYYEKFGFYPLEDTKARDMRLVENEGGHERGGLHERQAAYVRFSDSTEEFLRRQTAVAEESPDRQLEGGGVHTVAEETIPRQLQVCATEPIGPLCGLVPM